MYDLGKLIDVMNDMSCMGFYRWESDVFMPC